MLNLFNKLSSYLKPEKYESIYPPLPSAPTEEKYKGVYPLTYQPLSILSVSEEVKGYIYYIYNPKHLEMGCVRGEYIGNKLSYKKTLNYLIIKKKISIYSEIMMFRSDNIETNIEDIKNEYSKLMGYKDLNKLFTCISGHGGIYIPAVKPSDLTLIDCLARERERKVRSPIRYGFNEYIYP